MGIGEPSRSLGGAVTQLGHVTYSVFLVHLEIILDYNCSNYNADLQCVLTNAGCNERIRRNGVTERWRLTARGPSCLTLCSPMDNKLISYAERQ